MVSTLSTASISILSKVEHMLRDWKNPEAQGIHTGINKLNITLIKPVLPVAMKLKEVLPIQRSNYSTDVTVTF